MTYRTHAMQYRALAENRLENVNQGDSVLNQHAKASPRVAVQTAGQRGQLVLRYWILLAILAIGMLIASRAAGQAPAAVGRPLPPALTTRDAVLKMGSAKTEGLTKADLSPQWASYRIFEAYYRQYLFGKLMDPAYVAEYGSVMQAMLDDLDRAQKNDSPAVKLLSGWIVDGAKTVASGSFHPAARVNATLLLAHVDDKAAVPRTGESPVPAAAALTPLVQLYRAETNPDGVRAAALQGMLRHVKLGAVTNAQHKTAIAGFMLQLAESQPPAGRSPEAHAFMQRYAVDILNYLANPAVTPKTAETLVSLSTTAEKPSLIAAYAASKIGQLKAGQEAKVNEPSKVLASWAARAAATIDKELERIARLDPPIAVRDQPAMPTEQTPMMGGGYGGEMYGGGAMGEMGGMGGMMDSYGEGAMGGMGEMGGMEGMEGMYGGGMFGGGGMMAPKAKPQPPEVIAGRRRINHILQQLQYGVTGQQVTGAPKTPGGLLVTATANDKPAFDAWIKTVGDVATAINSSTLDDRKKFVDELKKQSDALKSLAGIPLDPASTAVAAPGAVDELDALSGPPMTVAPASATGQPGGGQPGSVVPAGGAMPAGGTATAGGTGAVNPATTGAAVGPGLGVAPPSAPSVPSPDTDLLNPGDDLLQ